MRYTIWRNVGTRTCQSWQILTVDGNWCAATNSAHMFDSLEAARNFWVSLPSASRLESSGCDVVVRGPRGGEYDLWAECMRNQVGSRDE